MYSIFILSLIILMDSSFYLTIFVAAVVFFTLYRKFKFEQEINSSSSLCLASPSPSPSLSQNSTHDVFLSFHGGDVRRDFLRHVQKGFERKGIISQFNDYEFERGESIGTELVWAIRGSRIAVVLFSKNYASSKWCLDELVEIMKYRREFGQIVLPIFYKVDPSDVRKQTGGFGEVFRITCVGKNNEEIRRWIEALADVSTIAGYHSNNWSLLHALQENNSSSSLCLASPPPPSSTHNWTYDVFPSFRGEDVRKGFLSHVQMGFERKEIRQFKDNEMERGEFISSELERAIRGSRIAVVFLSSNYASSKWCLDELVEILKCRRDFGQIVLPIFYQVDPSDVRNQTGDFGKLFRKTCAGKNKEEIRRWKVALAVAATLSGYHSSNCDTEAAMVEIIATDVSRKLSRFIGSIDSVDREEEALAIKFVDLAHEVLKGGLRLQLLE